MSPPSTGTAFITARAAGVHKPQHSWSPSCSEHQPAAPFLFSQPKTQLEGHQSPAEASSSGSNLPEPAESTRWVQVAPGGFCTFGGCRGAQSHPDEDAHHHLHGKFFNLLFSLLGSHPRACIRRAAPQSTWGQAAAPGAARGPEVPILRSATQLKQIRFQCKQIMQERQSPGAVCPAFSTPPCSAC